MDEAATAERWIGREKKRAARMGHGYRWTALAFGGPSWAVVVVGLLAVAQVAAGGTASATHVYGPPYKGGFTPSVNLVTYGCHAKATQVTPWHFSTKTGIAVGADTAVGKACPQTPYRVGSQSIGTAGGGVIASVATPLPSGYHNLTASIAVNYSAVLKETSGSSTNFCPVARILTHSGSYYDGSSWSYYPTFARPIVFSSATYYYFQTTHGASGSCSSSAQIGLQVQVVAIASNGLAGYGLANDTVVAASGGATYNLMPSTFLLGGYVSTVNTTSWSCTNYTLWDYGTWSNSTGSCSGSNNTVTNSWMYLNSKTVSGTNTSMSFAGLDLLSMSWYGNYSASKTWDVMMYVTCTTNAATGLFFHGAALASVNLGTGGYGIALKSITIR